MPFFFKKLLKQTKFNIPLPTGYLSSVTSISKHKKYIKAFSKQGKKHHNVHEIMISLKFNSLCEYVEYFFLSKRSLTLLFGQKLNKSANFSILFWRFAFLYVSMRSIFHRDVWEVELNYDLDAIQSNSGIKGIEIYIYMQLENEIYSTDAVWDKYFCWAIIYLWMWVSSSTM